MDIAPSEDLLENGGRYTDKGLAGTAKRARVGPNSDSSDGRPGLSGSMSSAEVGADVEATVKNESQLECLIDTPPQELGLCDAVIQDLVIELTREDEEQVYQYHVSMAALASASTVFRRMVDPKSRMPSIVNREDGRYYLPLHDDDPDSLLVLLRAIHRNIDLLPTHMEFEKLVSLAVLCDKYDCGGAIWPYRKRWSDAWASKALEPGHEAWVYICVTLGDARYFRELTKDILLNLVVTGSLERGDLQLWRDGKSFDVAVLPDGIIVDMLEQRQKLMLFLHSECRKFITMFEEATEYKSWNVNIDFGPYFLRYRCIDACACASYGGFLLGLRTKRIWKYLLEHEQSDTKIEINHLSPADFLKGIQDVFDDVKKAAALVDHSRHPRAVPELPNFKPCGVRKFIDDLLEKINERVHLCGLEARGYQRPEPMDTQGTGPEDWETFQSHFAYPGVYKWDRDKAIENERRIREME